MNDLNGTYSLELSLDKVTEYINHNKGGDVVILDRDIFEQFMEMLTKVTFNDSIENLQYELGKLTDRGQLLRWIQAKEIFYRMLENERTRNVEKSDEKYAMAE
jgi:hypothetical protein